MIVIRGTHSLSPDAAHPVLVAVRQDDHVAGGRPVLLLVADLHPAGAARDEVEEDEAVGAGSQDGRGGGSGQGLVGPGLAVLRAQEDRALEA